jgi:hypothetical protein
MLVKRRVYGVLFYHAVSLSIFRPLEHYLELQLLVSRTAWTWPTCDDHAPATLSPAGVKPLMVLARKAAAGPDALFHGRFCQSVRNSYTIRQVHV